MIGTLFLNWCQVGKWLKSFCNFNKELDSMLNWNCYWHFREKNIIDNYWIRINITIF